MKRRGFLSGLLALPAAAVAARLLPGATTAPASNEVAAAAPVHALYPIDTPLRPTSAFYTDGPTPEDLWHSNPPQQGDLWFDISQNPSPSYIYDKHEWRKLGA